MEGGWRKRKRGRRRRKGKGAGLKWERKRRAGAFEWSDGGARRRRRLASRAFDIAEDRVVFVHFYLYHFHWSKLTLRMGWGFVFFSMFVFQFHFSVEFAKWRTESDTKWRTKTRALNPFHNIPQKRRNNQKRRKKIKSFPKRKEQQKKQKVRGKHCPKNLPDVLSLTLLFFCNFIYPHPGRWKGSVVYQGGFELQVSPPSPGRRHHVARQAGEERGSGGRHFLLWRAGVEVLQARWFGFLWFVFNFVCLFLFLWLY